MADVLRWTLVGGEGSTVGPVHYLISSAPAAESFWRFGFRFGGTLWSSSIGMISSDCSGESVYSKPRQTAAFGFDVHVSSS